MKCLVSLIGVLGFLYTSAQTQLPGTYAGLASYSTTHNDLFSFTGNKAALGALRHVAAGVYGEKKFMLNELGSYLLAAALPTRLGNFGLEANYEGSSGFNQAKFGLAYARNLGDKVRIGTQFNYHGLSIAGYGKEATVSVEVGIIYQLTEKLNAGIQVSNPAGGKFGKANDEKLPSVYGFGLGFDASEKFFVSAVIVKEEDQPVNVNTGIHYQFLPMLHGRVGISTATTTIWSGIGLSLKNMRVDVSNSFHPQLGWTPGILFLFDLKKNTIE